MAGPRTAFGDAIGLGVKLFAKSTVPARTMIALTDGNDTAVERAAGRGRPGGAKDKGIVIHTVAIGDPAAAGEEKLDEAALKERRRRSPAAASTGALDRGELAESTVAWTRSRRARSRPSSFRPRTELFWVPVLALALLDAGAVAAPAELRVAASPLWSRP